MAKISPSILAADFYNLCESFDMMEEAKADYVHFDVMDGSFVPTITFGAPVLQKLKKRTKIPFDVHLMVVNPEKHFDVFVDAGADIMTFHAEATPHVHRCIQLIKKKGIKAGVVLNPHTPISQIQHVLCDVDIVLLMSVNPGFGGQTLIPEVLEKGKELRRIADEKKLDFEIEIDGGVYPENSETVRASGFDVIVAGSGVFGAKDPIDAMRKIKGE